MTTFELRPIADSFAREVHGLNCAAPLAEADRQALRQAWSEHGVLVFRGQLLEEDALVRFSEAFGEPDRIVREDWASKKQQAVIYISNLLDRNGTAIGGLGAGEITWHSDQSYQADPATGSFLYGVEIPADQGATEFANLRLAYATLPPALKALADRAWGVFSYAHRAAAYDESPDASARARAKSPDVQHPLVNRHPTQGWGALYLDPGTMPGIEGMADAEALALIRALTEHATQPPFVYRHDWRMGDLVMWDNGFTLHRRGVLDPAVPRLLKRTTVKLSPAQHIVPPTRQPETVPA
ncbi:MAG: TauD/TfdA family dioxygenase [Alphaproteobacteria bacterium]|nr:TauD/TfdA family dioxygenase [Alphaproteobacteria bacterium]MCB9928695.1 TauD/TfdA family dioxygenase [Alphaproteobacteria bacterium]